MSQGYGIYVEKIIIEFTGEGGGGEREGRLRVKLFREAYFCVVRFREARFHAII